MAVAALRQIWYGAAHQSIYSYEKEGHLNHEVAAFLLEISWGAWLPVKWFQHRDGVDLVLETSLQAIGGEIVPWGGSFRAFRPKLGGKGWR